MPFKFNPTTCTLDLVTSPGGGDSHVQFNDNGVFAGSNDLRYDKSNSVLYGKVIEAGNFSGARNNTTIVESHPGTGVYIKQGKTVGEIDSVIIDSGGSGYSVNDILTLIDTFGIGDKGKVKVTNVSDGEVTGVTIENVGTNYCEGTYETSGADGENCTIVVVSIVNTYTPLVSISDYDAYSIASFNISNLTSEKTFTFPDNDGTFALLESDQIFTGVNTFNGMKLNIRTETDSTTIATTDDILVCNKPTAMTVTLIAAEGTEQRFYIKNIGAGVVTVARASTDTIDGETTQTVNQYETLEIIDSASGNWSII